MRFGVTALVASSFLIHAIVISNAVAAPQSKAGLCALAKTPEIFQAMLQSPENLNPHENMGGLGGGGVCWWHSRLQRASIYLTYYTPSAPRPQEKQIKEILKNIRKGKAFVEIPGYENFSQFAEHNSVIIQKFLNDWQISNGVLGFGFLKGTQDVSSEVSSETMPERMDLLYKQVNDEKRITYQLIQTSGISAHAWLVTKMKKLKDSYELHVVDSNFPNAPYVVNYYNGDADFGTPYGRVKAFTQQSNELMNFSKTFENECGSKLWETKSEKETDIIKKVKKERQAQDSRETTRK